MLGKVAGLSGINIISKEKFNEGYLEIFLDSFANSIGGKIFIVFGVGLVLFYFFWKFYGGYKSIQEHRKRKKNIKLFFENNSEALDCEIGIKHVLLNNKLDIIAHFLIKNNNSIGFDKFREIAWNGDYLLDIFGLEVHGSVEKGTGDVFGFDINTRNVFLKPDYYKYIKIYFEEFGLVPR